MSGFQPSAGGGADCRLSGPPFGQSIEVGPDGATAYAQEVSTLLYRSYRVRDLYRGADPTPFAFETPD